MRTMRYTKLVGIWVQIIQDDRSGVRDGKNLLIDKISRYSYD